MLLGFLFRIVFRLFLIIFVWRERGSGKVHFIWRRGYEDVCGEGGWNFGCLVSGSFEKSVRWKGVKSGNKSKGIITRAGLARFAATWAPELNATKITLAITYNRASPVSWDPNTVMPGPRLEIFQVIRLVGQPGEWTKRETCTLLAISI